ncbi:MAG TPA: SOS response-associated peptidase [Candidatus Elarobacter sp.]|jgi:putative SOS response-associated peptidase YedK|nr:SOS response-associated peptidase [Candidatus Elarobacter sp.]
MCARFSLAGPERVADRYPQFKMRKNWPPRYNIAPTQDVLAARNDGTNEIVALRWGLVPFWARDLSIGQTMINARAETLAEKPAFRHALQQRRCVIFADGFYEWTGPKNKRQPYYFTLDDAAPFAFAGLWERWGPKDAKVETCTIVTCQPNELLTAFHDRMPAILDDGAIDRWLHGDVGEALGTIVPYDTARMRSSPVTPEMNRTTFEDPRAIEPMAPPQTLF